MDPNWWAKALMKVFLGFTICVALLLAAAVLVQNFAPDPAIKSFALWAFGSILSFSLFVALPAGFIGLILLILVGTGLSTTLSKEGGIPKALISFYKATHGLKSEMQLLPKEKVLEQICKPNVGFARLRGVDFAAAFGEKLTEGALTVDFVKTRFLARYSTSPNVVFLYDTEQISKSSVVSSVKALAKAKTGAEGKIAYVAGGLFGPSYKVKRQGNETAFAMAFGIFQDVLNDGEVKKLILDGNYLAVLQFRNGYAYVELNLFHPGALLYATQKVESIFAKLAEKGLIE